MVSLSFPLRTADLVEVTVMVAAGVVVVKERKRSGDDDNGEDDDDARGGSCRRSRVVARLTSLGTILVEAISRLSMCCMCMHVD